MDLTLAEILEHNAASAAIGGLMGVTIGAINRARKKKKALNRGEPIASYTNYSNLWLYQLVSQSVMLPLWNVIFAAATDKTFIEYAYLDPGFIAGIAAGERAGEGLLDVCGSLYRRVKTGLWLRRHLKPSDPIEYV